MIAAEREPRWFSCTVIHSTIICGMTSYLCSKTHLMSLCPIYVALESRRLPIHHPPWKIMPQTLLAYSIILAFKKLRLLDTLWGAMLPWLLRGITLTASPG